MPSQPLARVTDPAALDAAEGPQALLRIEVPGKWLRKGADIEVQVPKRLRCARCEGGGCDGCERAGAWRLPAEERARTLRLQLPEGHGDGVKLRLVRPFDGHAIEQLIVAVCPAQNSSKGVRKLPRAITAPVEAPPAPTLSRIDPLWVAAVVAAAVVALLALL